MHFTCFGFFQMVKKKLNCQLSYWSISAWILHHSVALSKMLLPSPKNLNLGVWFSQKSQKNEKKMRFSDIVFFRMAPER
jgi:hypothetical protein